MVLFAALTWAGQSCRNIYSQSGYALVDHAYKPSFFFYWSIGVVLHVNVEATLSTRLCSDVNKDTKYFRPTYFVKKPAFVHAVKPDSVKLLSSCFESTKYASINRRQVFFNLYFILVTVSFVMIASRQNSFINLILSLLKAFSKHSSWLCLIFEVLLAHDKRQFSDGMLKPLQASINENVLITCM